MMLSADDYFLLSNIMAPNIVDNPNIYQIAGVFGDVLSFMVTIFQIIGGKRPQTPDGFVSLMVLLQNIIMVSLLHLVILYYV
jgi:hypothetical protein